MTIQHTILGAHGIIGRTLTSQLRARAESRRLVDRTTTPVDSASMAADLLDPKQARAAVRDSRVVHFVVGLPYDNALWAAQFPAIMRNVISALEGSDTRLVFMDNVYMYGKVVGAMTEDQPYAAQTVKGLARKNLIDQLTASNLDFVVARSADFYGPGANANSLLNLFILSKLKAGLPASWLGGVDFKHSFTYTEDIAATMLRLARTPSASRTTWHVPTAEAKTIRELAELAVRVGGLSVQPEFQVLNHAQVAEYAKSDGVMNATEEMFYQFDSDYVFDSSRFERTFGLQPTSIDEGLRRTIAALP